MYNTTDDNRAEIQSKTIADARLDDRLQELKIDALDARRSRTLHELNNLLGIIIGNLDIVAKRTSIGEAEKQLIGVAIDAALRSADLLQKQYASESPGSTLSAADELSSTICSAAQPQ